MVEGSVWGALNLEELVENAFDDEDAQLLCILANQVAAGAPLGAAGRAARRPRPPAN